MEEVKTGGGFPYKEHASLLSRYTHGEEVVINFHESGKILSAKVVGIHFTKSKVSYDLEIKINPGGQEHSIVLKDIASDWVEDKM